MNIDFCLVIGQHSAKFQGRNHVGTQRKEQCIILSHCPIGLGSQYTWRQIQVAKVNARVATRNTKSMQESCLRSGRPVRSNFNSRVKGNPIRILAKHIIQQIMNKYQSIQVVLSIINYHSMIILIAINANSIKCNLEIPRNHSSWSNSNVCYSGAEFFIVSLHMTSS